MRKILILLVLAALGAGGWWYFKKRGNDAVQYQTAAVTRGDLTQAVTATGTLNPVVNVQVGSQISGNIQKLYADFNTPVKQGQVVAQLDPATFQAAVHQAEADLANAQAALELARITERRQQDLVGKKIGPQVDLDNAVAALHQAEALVKLREANLERAKVDLSRCTIYAPIDGIVISRAVDVGQTVAAAMNAPILFTIANDLRKMQIDANVAEADVGNVKVDQHVEFTVDAFPTRTFTGKVIQVRNAPITVQNVVTYDTVIEVNNDELLLKPGMTANVSLIVAQKQNVLKLPNAALRYRPADAKASTPPPGGGGMRGGGPGGPGGQRKPREGGAARERTIYTLAGGAPSPVQVKLGISDGITTEVLEGAKEGDTFITSAITPNAPAASSGGSPFGGGARRPF